MEMSSILEFYIYINQINTYGSFTKDVHALLYMNLRRIEENGATLYVSATPSFTKSSGDSIEVCVSLVPNMTIESVMKSQSTKDDERKKHLPHGTIALLSPRWQWNKSLDKVVMGVESRIDVLAAYTIMEPTKNNHILNK